MATLDINTELVSLTPSALLELFIIDTTLVDNNKLPISEQIIYIHNYVTEQLTPVYFDGQKYNATPCKFSNNELKGDGTQTPRPLFSVTNAGGYASRILRQTQGLIGAKVTRRRVFAKFLDTESWPSGPPLWNAPNINNHLSEDIYFVNRKNSENKKSISLSLVTGLELDGARIPRRRMYANNCDFLYRNSTGCNYTALPIADVTNKKFEIAVVDGGYGFTLSNQGEWDESTTYNEGDYVFIYSTDKRNEADTDFRKFFYVCLTNGIIGINFRPPSDLVNWAADECSKKINGCLCRYPLDDLRMGAFISLARAGF